MGNRRLRCTALTRSVARVDLSTSPLLNLWIYSIYAYRWKARSQTNLLGQVSPLYMYSHSVGEAYNRSHSGIKWGNVWVTCAGAYPCPLTTSMWMDAQTRSGFEGQATRSRRRTTRNGHFTCFYPFYSLFLWCLYRFSSYLSLFVSDLGLRSLKSIDLFHKIVNWLQIYS